MAVSLKVYNLLGQEVATLVENWQEAGVYRVKLKEANLGSGLYLYRLKANDFIQTRRMIILK